MAAHTEEKNGLGKTAFLICLVLLLAQTAFFIGWIWREEDKSGAEIRVALAPVDPRDLLRGQYLRLSYAFDRPETYPLGDVGDVPVPPGGQVCALLTRADDGRHEPLAYAGESAPLLREMDRKRLDEPVVIVGRCAPGGRLFDFGVNRYFVPEGSSEPSFSRTDAVLLIASGGKARIVRLLVDGVPWTPSPRGAE